MNRKLIAVLFFVSSWAYSESSAPSHKDNANTKCRGEKTNNAQSPTKEYIPIKKIITAPIINKENSKEKQKQRDEKSNFNVVKPTFSSIESKNFQVSYGTMWIYMFSLLVNVILALITYFLFKYTKKMWQSTNQMVINAEASSIAQEDSRRRELRAYIGVIEIIFKEGWLHIIFNNGGNTPSFKTIHYISCFCEDRVLTKGEVITKNIKPEKIIPDIAWGKAKYQSSHNISRHVDINKIDYVSVGIFINYRDVFEMPHETFFNAIGRRSPSDKTEWIFEFTNTCEAT